MSITTRTARIARHCCDSGWKSGSRSAWDVGTTCRWGRIVQAMYQIAFTPDLLPTLVPFLMLNRMGLTILLHPESGRPRDDHTLNAVWMGQVLPVKTEVLSETD